MNESETADPYRKMQSIQPQELSQIHNEILRTQIPMPLGIYAEVREIV